MNYRTPFSTYVSSATGCLTASNVNFLPTHGNSFIDLNGDCAADLFLQSVSSTNQMSFEIWIKNTNDGKFCLVEQTPVDLTTTPPVFYDIGIITPKDL